MVAARAEDWLAGVEAALKPPPRLSLSEWADAEFYLSPESAAEPGRWRTLPYQRGIMDAITDPAVERVTWMKSARVGATKCMVATIGYFVHQDPCAILVAQPTVEDAEGFSKEEIAPALRDCQALAEIAKEPTAKTSAQTILHKSFGNGALLSMVGANSGRGFRRVSRRVVIFDEVDGYPASAGAEGDPVELGIRRSEYFWNRKLIFASTPLTAGHSRIEHLFEQGDQRRYHVPCPHCGHRDILVFREGSRGHYMAWPEGSPEDAHFVCSANGCVIEHKHKRWMIEHGEWIADAPFRGHASFHLWAACSLSPNATWGQIASEFIAAKRAGPEKLKTFVNTVLGETWQERGEAPDWEKLYNRRERYPIGTVPDGPIILTCGVDVQKDRFVYQVTGWGEDKQRWIIDAAELYGDTSDEDTWSQLDELLARIYPCEAGGEMPITRMAVDSGYNTQQVYSWCRRYPMSRVMACKGVSTERALLGTPSPVDVNASGRRMSRGYKVWPVGVGIAKSELYGWLRLPPPEDGEPYPPGYVHFPELDQEYFKQLTAEHLVAIRKRSGHTVLEWQVQPGRQNHFLDADVYARAAASACGLDRHVPDSAKRQSAPKSKPKDAPQPEADRPAKAPARQRDSWMGRGGGKRKRRRGGWMDRGR